MCRFFKPKMECVICFDNKAKSFIKCCNKLCKSIICNDCLHTYLKHSKNNSTLPICAGNDCQAIYLYSDIQRVCGVNGREDYLNACYYSLVTEGNNEMNRKNTLELLKNERRKFVRESFPKAIALVAEITCKTKLNRKVNTSTIEQISGRTCMNLFCKGFLNENFTCNICNSSFCKECEKLIESNHKCLTEDLESLKVTRNYPQCPTCKLYVDKDNACNHVRCPNCNTKFIYGTNELSGSGGHTIDVPFKREIKLSVEYKNKLDLRSQEILSLIEKKQIKIVTFTSVLNAVINKDLENIAKMLDNYYKSKYYTIFYSKCMIEIEKLIHNSLLTEKILYEIYNKL